MTDPMDALRNVLGLAPDGRFVVPEPEPREAFVWPEPLGIGATLPEKLRPYSTRRKVALIGYMPTCYEAPWVEPGWEFWGINNLHVQIDTFSRPFSRWFNLHHPEHMRQDWTEAWPQHLSWARTQRTLPIYVPDPDKWPGCHTAVAFPKDEVEKLPHGTYHASSVDWMIALALREGFEEIGLWGLNMTESSEPISARACAEFWLGMAAARGAKIHLPRRSHFLKIFHLVQSKIQYGFDEFHLIQDMTERPVDWKWEP